jgi:hypothetical protein
MRRRRETPTRNGTVSGRSRPVKTGASKPCSITTSLRRRTSSQRGIKVARRQSAAATTIRPSVSHKLKLLGVSFGGKQGQQAESCDFQPKSTVSSSAIARFRPGCTIRSRLLLDSVRVAPVAAGFRQIPSGLRRPQPASVESRPDCASRSRLLLDSVRVAPAADGNQRPQFTFDDLKLRRATGKLSRARINHPQ